MATLVWSDRYCLGINIIDSQHQRLVNLINRLGDFDRDSDRDELEEIIAELVDYTVYHFSTEEKLMAEYDYEPHEREGHEIGHQRFLQKIHFFAENHPAPEKIATALSDFLIEWLKFHILEIDQNFAEFLKTKGMS